jgi:predicted Zn-dependent protease
VIERLSRVPHDLVGIYAGGTICRGFANSFGQRNWHEVETFNLEWSLYLKADKAVKNGYAGTVWDSAVFEERLAESAERLFYLDKTPRAVEPGDYRVYLAPRAMEELVALLNWGAWSARARQTRQSALLKLEHDARLSPKVSMAENTHDGVAPAFQQDGFVKPARVELIRSGALADALVSPRSSVEYALPANAANASETPESLDMAGGALRANDALAALDTGIYVSNLWYLNYSDRPAARITGMTRFATMWVERGRIVAPVNAMRFDDTIYRMLGENLVDLTQTPELMLDNSTYDQRTTSSVRLPGALLSGLRFTL